MKILNIGRESANEPEPVANEAICAIDVGTTKIVALIAEVDDNDDLRVIGAGRMPAQGLRRGVVVNTKEATAAIGQAVEQAVQSAGQPMRPLLLGISGSHINAMSSKGAVAVGRNGRNITTEDTQRALEQAKSVALPHNREIIHAVPRSYTIDDQKGIQDPVGMFGYRLEVDASIITGASSAVANLVHCVHDNGLEIEDLVLEPLASGLAVLNDDERRLGVALVDVGGGTSDLAIYLENAPWHTVIIDVGGDHFTRDVAMGLRMPYPKAEALIKQFGSALPGHVPADAEVRSGAFGEEGQQVVSRRVLAEILNARAQDVLDLILREVKRSGYDGLLPAGIVLTGGVAQLSGFAEMSRDQLQWPVRVGRPKGVASSVIDLSSPEYATAVGLLLWGKRHEVEPVISPEPLPGVFDRIIKWLRNFVPQ
ncbi:MAG: cell division protein FtsA [Anaerolineae bacterium]|jgi:cell division protein FtsA|nr:cell division protein FtsA [Anaerolineae bacterium]